MKFLREPLVWLSLLVLGLFWTIQWIEKLPAGMWP